MATPQPGILAPVPPVARALGLRVAAGANPRDGLQRLGALACDDSVVVGVGAGLAADLGRPLLGLEEIPALVGPSSASSPSTPQALWLWLRGTDRGALVHQQRALLATLGEAFVVDSVSECFKHREGRDLSGYEDGTENPKGDAIASTALVADRGAGVDGGSFVAVQRWQHDLPRFFGHDERTRDDMIGRRVSDNAELPEAPPSAHVKRTAQETFSPVAFVWRRSMPWADPSGEGLLFIAFASSLAPFTAQLRRMVGLEDGVADALFRFTRPTSTSSFFCPPRRADGRLDLSAFGV
jgi:putative iron-dependent peroxidase